MITVCSPNRNKTLEWRRCCRPIPVRHHVGQKLLIDVEHAAEAENEKRRHKNTDHDHLKPERLLGLKHVYRGYHRNDAHRNNEAGHSDEKCHVISKAEGENRYTYNEAQHTDQTLRKPSKRMERQL